MDNKRIRTKNQEQKMQCFYLYNDKYYIDYFRLYKYTETENYFPVQ